MVDGKSGKREDSGRGGEREGGGDSGRGEGGDREDKRRWNLDIVVTYNIYFKPFNTNP